MMLSAALALITALATLFWPSKSAGLLLIFAPILWGLGAAGSEEPASRLNVVVGVSSAATLIYARLLLLPEKDGTFIRLRTASIVYCAAVLPSVFSSAFLMRSFEGYVRLISPVVFMFALLHVSQARGAHAFHFKALALSAVSMFGLVLVAQYAGQGIAYMGGLERVRAFALSPIHISLYSVPAAGVLVCGVLLGRHRYVYVAGIVALGICTYLTGFRTAWIGMAVLIGIVMVIAVRSGFAKFVALLVALGLLATSGIIIESLARYARTDEAMSLSLMNNITSGRITTAFIGLDRYLAGNPAEWLFGIGVYSSQEATLEEEGSGAGVHSDFLATLVECGVLGLLGYLFLLFQIGGTLLRAMRCLPRQHPGRTFAAVGFATFMAVTIMGIPGALYTNVFVSWYYYGFIGFALAQLKKDDSPVREAPSHSYGLRRTAVSGNAMSGA